MIHPTHLCVFMLYYLGLLKVQVLANCRKQPAETLQRLFIVILQ